MPAQSGTALVAAENCSPCMCHAVHQGRAPAWPSVSYASACCPTSGTLMMLARLPHLLVHDDGAQLAVVPHQDHLLGAQHQRHQRLRLRGLRALIHQQLHSPATPSLPACPCYSLATSTSGPVCLATGCARQDYKGKAVLELPSRQPQHTHKATSHTFRKRKLLSLGSPAPAQVTQMTSAACADMPVSLSLRCQP